MAIPQRHRTSPWPFVAMIAMAAVFFLDAASATVAPWWAVAALMFVWLWLFVRACRWWTPHPRRTLWLPAVALAVWFAAVTAGGAWLGWTG